jgi:hypothetical protein
MERLVASGRFSGKELQQINYCRIYLQVFFTSAIANVKGTEVEVMIFIEQDLIPKKDKGAYNHV